MMNPIIDAALGRSRMVLLTLALIFFSGIYAFVDIPKESDPDIDIPNIYVNLMLDGVSPADSERLLLRPMEKELSGIEGVKEMKASAFQGGGFVLLEFDAGFDKDSAMKDVREAVDKAKPELPADAEEPTVEEVNFSLFPVLIVSLSGDVPERTLLRLARDLQDRIENIPTVLEAPIAGDRDEQVEIVVDPAQIESYGLDGVSLLQFFDLSNRLVAAGNIDTGAGRFAVEIPGLLETVNDILDMPVRAQEDSAVLVRDIAQIRKTFKDPENFARINGEPAIALEVVKRTGENIIETIEAVRKVVEQAQKEWPPGVRVSYTQDRSADIRLMLTDLGNNILAAVLLVMIVVIGSLGWRSGLLVGVAIPGSFLSGILIIYAMGLTVNVVVLFALILSTGMLVDGAVIITEYADRKMIEGLNRRDAYAAAAKRMAWPVTTSIASMLAAFAPLMFWPDIVGEFMKYLPLTMIAVLSSSLLMAMIFVPALGALIGKPGHAASPETLKAISASEEGDLSAIGGFTGWYVCVLGHALRRPGLVLLAAAVMLVGVQFAYASFGKGVEFFPEIEPDRATVLVHARGNLSVYEKDDLVRMVEDRIMDVKGVETFYARSGKSVAHGVELAEDVIGQIQLEFADWDKRPKADAILAEISARTADIPGIQVETQKEQGGPQGGKDVQIQLASGFPELLSPAVEKMRAALEEIGGFVAEEDTRPLPGIDWEMEVDRAQAAKFGLNVTVIGQYVRMVTNGLKVADYRPDGSDDEIDIVIRHPEGMRTLDQLDNVRITGVDGKAVPVTNFVKRVARPATGTISRSDQKRVLMVRANVPPGTNVTEKVDQVRKWLEDHKAEFDPRIAVSFRGEDEDQREAQTFLRNAFFVALFIMAIIMVTQFNSFYSTLLVLSAVVLSTIGVFIGLLITQQPFGIVMSGIGVIALAGIIVHNNVILIDTYDKLRDQYGDSMPMREIVLRTGAQRLRPVLLTSVTAVLGLLPMVFQVNIDFITRHVSVGAPSTQWWTQLSTAIAFGLSFATVLTLVVTPCALMFRGRKSRIVALLRRIAGRP